MQEGGLLHENAVHRLMGRLKAFRSDLRMFRDALRTLSEAKTMPIGADLRALKARLVELEAYEPSFRQALVDSPLLDSNVSAEVEDLCRHMAKARNAAAFLTPGSPYGSPPPSEVSQVQVAAMSTVKFLESADEVVTDLTVATDVKKELHRRRVGKALHFDELFKDTIPSEEQRKKIFGDLAKNAGYIEEGVFDIGNRKIWRKSSRQAERVFTYSTPILFGVLGLGVLWLLSELVPSDSPKLGDTGEVLTAYGLVLGGAVFHLLVESTKQSQAATHSVIPIGDFLDWLHLRWVSLGKSYFHVLVTVVGLRWLGVGISTEEDILLFFFAGYGVDSVAGLFLARFATAAASGLGKARNFARGQAQNES